MVRTEKAKSGDVSLDSSAEYWTVEEIAARHRTTPQAIHQQVHRGTAPPAYRIGRRLLFKRPEVLRWEAEREVRAAG